MKYLYLSISGLLFLILIILLLQEGERLNVKEEAAQISRSFHETGEFEVALNLLIPRVPVPKVPLKDLFSDPRKHGATSRNNIEQVDSVVTESIKATRTITIATPPRLIGVIIRDSETRAFFVENDKLYSLKQGDALAGRYRISSIASDKVSIKEVSTGVSRNIYIKDE
ncbi:MAG: hypothetical protein GWN00_19150 [Aliifodinibius sp.]|nr:hypothetical protein [Fodinibius sp.]NIV16002.1 hypothetical protein [Fodinibius sp.]NIY26845.1 hypothetical protein [Fodinibius sp.]